ncbi:MAG: dTDP-glucose 4,6-dehydratase [Deltaproteobacteria bacterium]|nr:dTDP-glucose 4,6-dehydratase [Deltaproteobacteria bacterium]
MEKIVVTGGAGFIGSHFIKLLLKKTKNYKVLNIDKLTYAANLKTLSSIEHDTRYEFIQSDICDIKRISSLVREADYIVNFAAESHVDRSIADATDFIRSNVEGVQVLLDLIRSSKKIKRYLQISTDEVYGSAAQGSFKEMDPLNPSSPYSASKASADLVIHSYIKTHGIPAVITRTTNNYGPYQFCEKLIPSFTTLALQNKPLPLYGNGNNIRDWIYVGDNCEALLAVLTEGQVGHVYNIGSQCEKSNIEITQEILDILKKPWSLVQHVSDRPGHDTRYSLDTTKIKNEIGWSPRYSFHESFPATIEWYKNNQSWWLR